MANSSKVLRANAALTVSEDGAAQTTPYQHGVTIDVVTTNKASSGSLVVKLQRKLHGTSTWVDLTGAATAAITTNTTTSLTMYPGLSASANTVVNAPLPGTWRAVYTISGGTFDVAAYATLHG